MLSNKKQATKQTNKQQKQTNKQRTNKQHMLESTALNILNKPSHKYTSNKELRNRANNT